MTEDTFTPPHGMGRIPDKPDRRDYKLYPTVPIITTDFPATIDLEKDLPGWQDQAIIGSCTGWSAAHVAFASMKKDKRTKPYLPSPVFLYLQARIIGGYPEQDCGAEIRNVWSAAKHIGMPPISALKPAYDAKDMPDPNTWLFKETSVWRKAPTASLLKKAELRQALKYYRLENLADMLKCLSEGYPINIGFQIFRSFYDDFGNVRKDIPDPSSNERSLGGHAVTIYGYDIPNRRFLLRNQWGAHVHAGTPNFTLSFDYVRQYAEDAWTCRLIEGFKKNV